jgi:hypothetical protein
VRGRRGWRGRFIRSRHYVDDAVRVNAREAREAGALPGHRQIRVVIGAVVVDVALRWRQQPRAARGGGGGAALTFLCPVCRCSRRSLYLLRAPAPVVGCRGCLRLVYRSQGVDRLERRRRRAARLEIAKDRPRIWSTTRLRALEAWVAAERSFWANRFARWPAWMGPAPSVDAFWP